MSEFPIEKGVPMPSKANVRYPWDEMEVGDSFFVEGASHGRLNGPIAFQLRKTGHKHTARKVEGGIRVWRVE